MSTFDDLVDEALAAPFEGWDFAFMRGRVEIEEQPWDYARRVDVLAAAARTFVDLGTGGGEFVAALEFRPPLTVATEGWMPNVPVAGRLLQPLGVHVVAYEGAPDNVEQTAKLLDGKLPFRDGCFDVAINRHESFVASDVFRILRPGGTFLTQQVGGLNESEFNDALGVGPPQASPTLADYVRQFEEAGFELVEAREAFMCKRYLDIGAVAYFAAAIPWQFDGLDVRKDRDSLRPIHETIERYGSFHSHQHRFLLEATKS